MNNDFILQRTGNFSDFLLKFLANPESAKHYLEVSLSEDLAIMPSVPHQSKSWRSCPTEKRRFK